MIDGYSARQVRDAEAPHLAAGEPLMARAAAALAHEIRSVLSTAVGTPTGAVLLLVGSGNNGGDALFAGAELAASGCAVTVIEVGSRTHEAGLAAALGAGARTVDVSAAGQDGSIDAVAVRRVAADADVIVDGILGIGAGAATGSSPALRGTARAVVAAVLPVLDQTVLDQTVLGQTAPDRSGRPRVVAVDIPSGIDPDDGGVPDATVLPADVTVTFGGRKAGLLLPPARELAGEVRLIDIGLGADLARVQPIVTVPD